MLQHIQNAWDSIVATGQQAQLISSASSNTFKAHLPFTASSHSGDWLQAPPIMAAGLRFDNKTISLFKLQTEIEKCKPYTCACGK